jgi:hypothetical protein
MGTKCGSYGAAWGATGTKSGSCGAAWAAMGTKFGSYGAAWGAILQLQRAHAVSDSTIGLCKLYVVTYYQDCRWQNGRLFDGGLKHFYSPLTHLGKL